ncbi:hypothetical protein PO124_08075 [Bacillus licheniformis]|nr:hypothetical protein [Bacillus licheniformis]
MASSELLQNIHHINGADGTDEEQRPISRPLGAVFVLAGGIMLLLLAPHYRLRSVRLI